MSATRIFSKFKELLDVTWSSVSDGYFLKRSGVNIVGVPGDQVGPIWRGEYSSVTTYQPNDAVSYQGSSYRCGITTTGVAPVPSTASYLIPPLATTGSMGSIAALPVANQALYYARGDNTWQLLSVTAANLAPGMIVQKVVAYNSALFTVSSGTTIPVDDTIPQNTEGIEWTGLVPPFTPILSNSKILLTFSGMYIANGQGTFTGAIFRDTQANAIGASVHALATGFQGNLIMQAFDTPGAGTFQYKVRFGVVASTGSSFNAILGSRVFGGVSYATFTIEEIKQ